MSMDQFFNERSDGDISEFIESAKRASHFIKALSHETRLLILCFLSSGEKSVTELENMLSTRQSAVSQQLARLRLDGLVATRRDGKMVYYSLLDSRAIKLVETLKDIFCPPQF